MKQGRHKKMHIFGTKLLALWKSKFRRFSTNTQKKNLLRNVDRSKNVVYGGELPIPTPRQSIGRILFDRLTQNQRANNILQVCNTSKDDMTNKKFVEDAVAVAERLKKEGIQKGDYIALIGNNSLNMNIALAGIFFLGAVPFPITHKTSPDEFIIVLGQVRPKFYACDRANLNTLQKILRAIGENYASKIFLLTEGSEPDVQSFKEFIADGRKNIEGFKPAGVDNPEEELALILKGARHETYGKGIGITHYNLSSVIARFEFESAEDNAKEVMLMVQKIMWMSGLYSFLKCCCCGSKLIVMNEFEEEGFMQAIEDYQVTSSYIYSSKLWQLYKYNYQREYNLSSCKYLQAFDGALPISLIKGMKNKLGLTLKSSYGLNELTGLGLQPSRDQNGQYKDGTICELVPQMYGKVISDNTLRKAGPYEKGEICFKGPVVTKGYINDPKSTRRVFDKEGYLQSGLYGYYDNNGNFFLIGNVHHVITYKGYEISPRQLEGLIKSMEPVKDALVSGIRHPTDGHYPIAFVSLQSKDTNTKAEEIINFVNGKVDDHQKLRGGVVFLPKIPRSRDTGALKRNLFKRVLSKYTMSKEVSIEIQSTLKAISDEEKELRTVENKKENDF